MSEERPSYEKKREQKARESAMVDPTPKNERVFHFLVDLFPEGGGGFPQKVSIAVCYGPTGMRNGPAIKEFTFKPNAAAPTREHLVEMSNEILRRAQDDCDELDRPTKYVVLAHDAVRSDRPYARVVMKLRPSGTTPREEDVAGEEYDNDPVRLLREILESERRDKRWAMEMMANLTSGVTEHQTQELDQMRGFVADSFDQRTRMISEFERIRSEEAARALAREAQAFRLGLYKEGFEFLKGWAPTIFASFMSKSNNGSLPPASTPESLAARQFFTSLSPEEHERIFGVWQGDACAKQGVFNADQCRTFAAIAEGEVAQEKLDEVLRSLFASIHQEQFMAAQQILPLSKLAPLKVLYNRATRVPTNTTNTTATEAPQA